MTFPAIEKIFANQNHPPCQSRKPRDSLGLETPNLGQAFVEEVEIQQQELPIAEQTEDVIRGQNMRRSKISRLLLFFFPWLHMLDLHRFTWYNGINHFTVYASLTHETSSESAKNPWFSQVVWLFPRDFCRAQGKGSLRFGFANSVVGNIGIFWSKMPELLKGFTCKLGWVCLPQWMRMRIVFFLVASQRLIFLAGDKVWSLILSALIALFSFEPLPEQGQNPWWSIVSVDINSKRVEYP